MTVEDAARLAATHSGQAQAQADDYWHHLQEAAWTNARISACRSAVRQAGLARKRLVEKLILPTLEMRDIDDPDLRLEELSQRLGDAVAHVQHLGALASAGGEILDVFRIPDNVYAATPHRTALVVNVKATRDRGEPIMSQPWVPKLFPFQGLPDLGQLFEAVAQRQGLNADGDRVVTSIERLAHRQGIAFENGLGVDNDFVEAQFRHFSVAPQRMADPTENWDSDFSTLPYLSRVAEIATATPIV